MQRGSPDACAPYASGRASLRRARTIGLSARRAPTEREVEHRHHEQVERGGAHEASEDHHRHRVLDLVARRVAREEHEEDADERDGCGEPEAGTRGRARGGDAAFGREPRARRSMRSSVRSARCSRDWPSRSRVRSASRATQPTSGPLARPARGGAPRRQRTLRGRAARRAPRGVPAASAARARIGVISARGRSDRAAPR